MFKILDLFWPILEGDEIDYTDRIKIPKIEDEDNLNISIDLALHMHVQQRERIKSIESKSMIFIGLFGSVIAVFGFILKDFIYNEDSIIKYLLIVYFSIITIYATKVISCAIKALMRQNYNVVSEAQFINQSKPEIISNLINTLKSNYNVINKKVDQMTLAHEFIKRILYMFFSFGIFIFVYAIYRVFSLANINLDTIENVFRFIKNNMVYFIIGLIIWNILITIRIITIKK